MLHIQINFSDFQPRAALLFQCVMGQWKTSPVASHQDTMTEMNLLGTTVSPPQFYAVFSFIRETYWIHR